MMQDTAEPELSTFSKYDLVDYNAYDPNTDPEFTELDNSLDSIPDNFKRPSAEIEDLDTELTESSVNKFIIVGEYEDYSKVFYNVESNTWVSKSIDATLFDDRNKAIEVLYDLDTSDFYTTRVMIKPVVISECDSSSKDSLRKPVPEGMTVESLVEEMEENEDTVECKWCNELFDKSECRYEIDLGYLCPRCEAAIKSRGETLTFRESCLSETFDPKEVIDLDYDKLTTSVVTGKYPATEWDPPEYKEADYTDSFSYGVTAEDLAVTMYENFMTEEDAKDVPGGLDALMDDDLWYEYLNTHFDTLFEKYRKELLDFYEEEAIEAAEEDFQDRYESRIGPDPDSWHDDFDID
jgi:hypothetical protein